MAKSKRKRNQPRESKSQQAVDKMPGKRSARWGVAVIVLVVFAGVSAWLLWFPGAGPDGVANRQVAELSETAQRGAIAFDANCARCHGVNGIGSKQGPPLVHKIYEPSHHGDGSFRRAARFGVKPHHWQFGAMPKITVSDHELTDIIAYVRELQRLKGIF